MSAVTIGRPLKASADSRRRAAMVGADLGDARGGAMREKDDFYPTPPDLVRSLLAVETFGSTTPTWECACGDGAISGLLTGAGVPVLSTDLVDRGYGLSRRDFLLEQVLPCVADGQPIDTICTNPPFKLAEMFWRHAIALGARRVVLLCRLSFLEGLDRAAMFRAAPPSRVWICPYRAKLQRGRQATAADSSGMWAYAWFVHDRGHKGPPVLGWLPDTRVAP